MILNNNPSFPSLPRRDISTSTISNPTQDCKDWRAVYTWIIILHGCIFRNRWHIKCLIVLLLSVLSVILAFRARVSSFLTSWRLNAESDPPVNLKLSCHLYFPLPWIRPWYNISNLVACNLNSRTISSATDLSMPVAGLCHAAAPPSVTEQVAAFDSDFLASSK